MCYNKKKINLSKKAIWNKFISGIDYRINGPRAYRLFSSLSNERRTKQSHLLKVNDKEVADKTEIASKFNTFYLTQHKLEPNRKKKERYIEKKGCEQRDGHLEELFTKEFSMEELKGSNKKH